MSIGSFVSVVVLACLSLTSCRTAATFDEYAVSIPPVSSPNGRIFVYRIATEGRAIRPSILLDGEPVGRAIPGGFFYLDLPSGNYEIAASADEDRGLQLRLRSGGERYVRLEVEITTVSWNVSPVLVDAQTGREELRQTKYVGALSAAYD